MAFSATGFAHQVMYLNLPLRGRVPFSPVKIFLQILDGYKIQVHARYSNIYALWTEVYITSVFPPEELYKKMVEESARGLDKQQLSNMKFLFFPFFLIFFTLFLFPSNNFKKIFVHLHNTIS